MLNLFLAYPLHFFFAVLILIMVITMIGRKKEATYAMLGITALSFMIVYSLDVGGVISFISR